MTENEAEVLAELEELAKETGAQCIGFRPLDFGGHDRSHHAQTAIRMCAKGWVERTFGNGWSVEKLGRTRGSCRYRITTKGSTALANHQEIVRHDYSMSEARGAKLAVRIAARKVAP